MRRRVTAGITQIKSFESIYIIPLNSDRVKRKNKYLYINK